MLRSVVATFGTGGGPIESLSPEGLAAIIERARMLESVCKTARDAVRTCVINAGGVVQLEDGRELAIEVGEKREINFAAAENVIAAHVGERWRGIAKIGNGDLEDLVRESAPPRGKGKAVKALWDELDAADAITFVPTETLKIRKSTKLIPQEV
jgi:hypothetical protein